MKNILLLFAVMIFLFSCRKNREGEFAANELNTVTGNWIANYLNKSIQVNIDGEKNFSMSVPVIVKKESNAAPVTLNFTLSGICIRQDAGYELRIDGFSATGQKLGGDNSLEEIKLLISQSMEGAEIAIERTTAVEKMAAKLSSDHGKLMLTGL